MTTQPETVTVPEEPQVETSPVADLSKVAEGDAAVIKELVPSSTSTPTITGATETPKVTVAAEADTPTTSAPRPTSFLGSCFGLCGETADASPPKAIPTSTVIAAPATVAMDIPVAANDTPATDGVTPPIVETASPAAEPSSTAEVPVAAETSTPPEEAKLKINAIEIVEETKPFEDAKPAELVNKPKIAAIDV
ncbi:hypothetical protein HDU93_009869 [Gonapodya sp. JEL0774]|nr:hypothetical protein HDU93_009869 [Gonapodya sp. JEL0774]